MIYIGIDNGNACNFAKCRYSSGMDKSRRAEAQRRYSARKNGIHVPLLKKGPPSINGYAKSEFKCATCESLFIGLNRPDSDPKKCRNRYCSRECYSKKLKGESNPNYKGNKPCRGCGIHIMGAQRAFCSSECEKNHYIKCAEIRKPQDKLNRNMRRSVTRFLANGVKGNRSWRSLTGFSSDELMNHLESQFKEGMTWENYGSYWHLDHIKPVAAFTFSKPEDKEFKDCWSISNLQPLEASENLKKNSKYNGTRVYRYR